jgi:hypothetical protein
MNGHLLVAKLNTLRYKQKLSTQHHTLLKTLFLLRGPPTPKQVLTNQCSPWQLQHPLFCALPSYKSIKKQTFNMLASVTAMLMPRQHHNSKVTSSSTNNQLRQWSPVLITPAGLTAISTSYCKSFTWHPKGTLARSPGVLQGRTPTQALANLLWWELPLDCSKCERLLTNGPFQGQQYNRHH